MGQSVHSEASSGLTATASRSSSSRYYEPVAQLLVLALASPTEVEHSTSFWRLEKQHGTAMYVHWWTIGLRAVCGPSGAIHKCEPRDSIHRTGDSIHREKCDQPTAAWRGKYPGFQAYHRVPKELAHYAQDKRLNFIPQMLRPLGWLYSKYER